jgi:hypothetical protein
VVADWPPACTPNNHLQVGPVAFEQQIQSLCVSGKSG